jgi:pimeloyl-ACP methyl ester carboxylesterase
MVVFVNVPKSNAILYSPIDPSCLPGVFLVCLNLELPRRGKAGKNMFFGKLHVEILGQGLPLLCLPAFPLDSRMFQGQQLLQNSCRLILPDYPGTGQSSLEPGQPSGFYTVDYLADRMRDLLDVLGLGTCAVLGVSMGGYVALAMFQRFPERFRGLVLADTRPDADDAGTLARRQQTVEGLQREGTAFLKERLFGLFAPATQKGNPRLIEEAEAHLAEATPEGLVFLTRGLGERPDRTALMPRIRVPCLVLCGENDRVSTPEVMRDMAGRIPGSEFHLIPEAGHLGVWEQPGLVNPLLRTFLEKIQP